LRTLDFRWVKRNEVATLVTSRERRALSRRILDLCFLIGSALILCALGVGAFVIAEVRHTNPIWVLLSLISIGFFAFAKEEYRSEFRSVRFILFVCGWIVINIALVVSVLASFGWLWLFPVLFFEQVLFYMSAYWIFGLQPPGRGRQD
jgi:hypothetical protein